MNILYTIGCPICKMLEARLKEKKVSYEECTDKNVMRSLGIEVVPVFYHAETEKYMTAQEALLWVNKL